MDVLNIVLDLLVFQKPPYDMIISLPTVEALQARIGYGTQPVTLKQNNEIVDPALEHDMGQKPQTITRTYSASLTSDVDSECDGKDSGTTLEGFLSYVQSIKVTG